MSAWVQMVRKVDPYDPGMVREGEWCFRSIGILPEHGDMRAFFHRCKPQRLEGFNHLGFRRVNGEFGHPMEIPASATNASRTGDSVSRTSLPKVAM